QDITRTWLGLVGPHVRSEGETGAIFSDHTDVRPTLMHLAGLTDDYAHDGRVLVEILDGPAPQAGLYAQLANAYKPNNPPLGTRGRRTLELSTAAVLADDATYAAFDAQLESLTATRNAIASRMIAILEGAEFGHTPINAQEAQQLIQAANTLIKSVP